MANVFSPIYQQIFVNTDTITVNHGGDLQCVGFQLVISGIVRPDLVLSSVPDKVDPKNKFVIILNSNQTGLIQVFKPDLLLVNVPTAAERATLCDLGVFGTERKIINSTEEDSTTSTEWRRKIRLEIVNVPAGKYRVGWGYEWRMSNSSFNYVGRVRLDDTINLSEHSTRSVDADSYHPVYGANSEVNLTTGNHFIDIEYKSSSLGKTAYNRNAMIEFWRVS